jgi:protein-L-isoaspartate(D-aspartate) O-methyltransferase
MAPFAAIIVTAAPAYLPRPLWDQLAEGGRMVIPIGAQPEEQVLWLIRKTAGKLDAQGLGAVRFVPLISPLLDDPSMQIRIRTSQVE